MEQETLAVAGDIKMRISGCSRAGPVMSPMTSKTLTTKVRRSSKSWLTWLHTSVESSTCLMQMWTGLF